MVVISTSDHTCMQPISLPVLQVKDNTSHGVHLQPLQLALWSIWQTQEKNICDWFKKSLSALPASISSSMRCVFFSVLVFSFFINMWNKCMLWNVLDWFKVTKSKCHPGNLQLLGSSLRNKTTNLQISTTITFNLLLQNCAKVWPLYWVWGNVCKV